MSKQVRPVPTDLVKQSNRITTAKYDMTPLEMKGMLLAYSKFTEYDKEFQKYEFPLRDVAKAFGQEDGKTDNLRTAFLRLAKKPIEVLDAEAQEYSIYAPLPAITINEKSQTVTFKLNEDLKPFFLELRREYTMFPAEYAFRLQGKYSLRIFQLLMQWQGKEDKKGFWCVSLNVQELREMFKIRPDEYVLMSKFRIGIIERSIAEINNAEVGLHVTMGEPEKRGKNIVAFTVNVQRMMPGEPRYSQPATKAEMDDDAFIAKHQELFDKKFAEVRAQSELAVDARFTTPGLKEITQKFQALRLVREELQNGKKTRKNQL